MRKKLNIEEVKAYIRSQGPSSKIYIGADSERYRKNDVWYADYTLAVVIHIDGQHGCKVFGEIQTELDFDSKSNKPNLRLMNEVYKVSELYHKLEDILINREVEIHLDINPDEHYSSSAVLQQAVGYVKGVCNIEPKVKPYAFAASCASDRLKDILTYKPF